MHIFYFEFSHGISVLRSPELETLVFFFFAKWATALRTSAIIVLRNLKELKKNRKFKFDISLRCQQKTTK